MNHSKKRGARRCRRLWFLAALLLIFIKTGCAGRNDPAPAQQTKVSMDSFYFDTICSITIYDMEEMSEENARGAIREAFDACKLYEDLLSRTREGTDVSRINQAQGSEVTVDPRTAELIRMSIPYCEESEGKFDITIGRVSDLWDFHGEESAAPSAEAVEAARKTVNYKNVQVGEGTIALLDPEACIDLGAVAKGYIADRLCEVLREKGVTSAIISLGGNIACVGGKPSDTEDGQIPFTIGVETPFSDRTEILGTVPCQNATVVTSGIYERCFVQDGKLYHHILDARTGWPCETDVIGVTVTAAEGKSLECDALATVCLLLGSEKGMKLIEETEGIEALFVTEEGITLSSGMEFKPVQ